MDEQISGKKSIYRALFRSLNFELGTGEQKDSAKILICSKSHKRALSPCGNSHSNLCIRTDTTATATISRTSGANERTGAETLAKREAEELKEKLTD